MIQQRGLKLTVDGIPGLKKKLLEKAKELGGQGDVIVGFTQHYAVHVHENLQAKHKEGKTAHYLLKAARMIWPLVPKYVNKMVAAGHTIVKGLIVAGLRIQREAQLIVPVDTGALRASAYTCMAKDEPVTASVVQAKSEAVKKKAIERRAKGAAKKAHTKAMKAMLKKGKGKSLRKGKKK